MASRGLNAHQDLFEAGRVEGSKKAPESARRELQTDLRSEVLSPDGKRDAAVDLLWLQLPERQNGTVAVGEPFIEPCLHIGRDEGELPVEHAVCHLGTSHHVGGSINQWFNLRLWKKSCSCKHGPSDCDAHRYRKSANAT